MDEDSDKKKNNWTRNLQQNRTEQKNFNDHHIREDNIQSALPDG